jgi:hypothetical protein
MRRSLMVAVAVVALLISVAPSPAEAGADWCWDDPIITIHSHAVHVTTGFDAAYLKSLTGPVEYIAVVRTSDAAETTIDASMATLPTNVSFYAIDDLTFDSYFGSQVDVLVAVRVHGKKNFDTLNIFTSSLGSNSQLVKQNGKSNAWLYVSYNFQAQ